MLDAVTTRRWRGVPRRHGCDTTPHRKAGKLSDFLLSKHCTIILPCAANVFHQDGGEELFIVLDSVEEIALSPMHVTCKEGEHALHESNGSRGDNLAAKVA